MYAERLKKLDTASVTDAMDRLGLFGALYHVKPVIGGQKICGKAFTVHYVPCGLVKGTVGDFLDDVKPGEVVVIDNDGRDDCTVWGDIMAFVAKQKGIEGTVINGVCRDLPAVREYGYPIFSKGYYMVTGKDRVEVDGVNVPVNVSDVRINPGDYILGDDSGVVCIPAEYVETVIEIAESIEATEQEIIKEIKKGSTLKDARAKTGYHHLQTRETEKK